ncbi:MAG: carboxypeptidase M32 [Candidatus Thermoplasmatota archaeon]|nr:carboxypeptidase M32 [Candidatus Thermoplasmatota archaeon]
MKAYNDFIELVKEYYNVVSIEMHMSWDQETYMPPGAVKDRSLQLATLSRISHEMLTSKQMKKHLEELTKKMDKLTPVQQANVRDMEWQHHRAATLPSSFVMALTKKRSEAFHIWVKAKKESDFPSFAPHLSELVDMKKQEAEYIGYEKKPYDALLDGFEKGLTMEKLDPMFKELGKDLANLVSKIMKSGVEADTSFVTCNYPVEKQRDFCERLNRYVGFDYERGRMDEAPHPFTAGSLNDTRITVRYYPDDPRPAFFSALHESGHALYEQGFLQENYGTALGQAISFGMHESQSRIVENVFGRSLSFWKFWYPELQKAFPKQTKGKKVEDWYAAINDVHPSLIRTEADEVTYNLHIILRYEMESALFSGKLDPLDAPEMWNKNVKKYLGLEVPDDGQGILQDIHWSHAAFGYFPSYTLGNLYSAQFYDALQKDVPDVCNKLESGNFSSILDWLRTNIHQHGKLYEADEMVKKVSGKAPSQKPFMNYLNEKYGELYGV